MPTDMQKIEALSNEDNLKLARQVVNTTANLTAKFTAFACVEATEETDILVTSMMSVAEGDAAQLYKIVTSGGAERAGMKTLIGTLRRVVVISGQTKCRTSILATEVQELLAALGTAKTLHTSLCD